MIIPISQMRITEAQTDEARYTVNKLGWAGNQVRLAPEASL